MIRTAPYRRADWESVGSHGCRAEAPPRDLPCKNAYTHCRKPTCGREYIPRAVKLSEEYDSDWSIGRSPFEHDIATAAFDYTANPGNVSGHGNRGGEPFVHHRSEGNAIRIHGLLLDLVDPRRVAASRIRDSSIGQVL